MLRISCIDQDENLTVLKLDGKISGTCVSNLREECLRYKNEYKQITVLDFSGVTYIDPDGVKMLEDIKDERVHIVNCQLFIKTLLGDLVKEEQ